MEQRTLKVSSPALAAEALGFFRWGRVGGTVVVTNDAGDWAAVSEDEFADLLAGRIAAGHPRFAELQGKGFLREGLDLDALAARISQRNRHIRRGAHLHVVTVTRRGGRPANGASSGDLDLSREVAERIVDVALQSMSPALTFELQGDGGEPLLNLEVVRHLVEFARAQNRRAAGKTLRFRLFSNLSAMSEEIAEWLLANDVRVVTSLDGPAALHDANRSWKPGAAHAEVVRWIAWFQRRAAELGREAHQVPITALPTITRHTLGCARELVDEYVARDLRAIHLRPLDRFRVAADVWTAVGYTTEEYLDFYRRALAYILDLNRRGGDIREQTASIAAAKILSADDPGIVDWQSPCGDGTGQLAYDVDGRVFPSDEARLADAMGDALFELGHVGDLSLAEAVQHPTVRALAAASLLDVQPMCADCWNKPFCGFSAVRNFLTQGDLFGQRPLCGQCKEHMGVSTSLFEHLVGAADAETAPILERWAAAVARHGGDARSALEAP